MIARREHYDAVDYQKTPVKLTAVYGKTIACAIFFETF